MDKDYLKIQIENTRNMKDNIWGALLLTLGGTISLSFSPANFSSIIFIAIGAICCYYLISGYISRYKTIKRKG